MKKFLSKTFTLLGIVFILISLYFVFERFNPKRLSFNNYSAEQDNSVERKNAEGTKPVRLRIADLGIDLPIIPADPPKNGRWETTYNGISYLNNTPYPGVEGNSVFYGHNWASLLGNLKNAKVGSSIEVIFENGAVRHFNIEYVQIVGPNQTDILKVTKDKRITIYTCIGFFDSKRLVVTGIEMSSQF